MDDPGAILIVEDDELVQTFLCRALAGVAGDVDACIDGASALSAIGKRQYGLILLDGLLPDLHGIDLGKQLIDLPTTRCSALCLVSGSLRFAQTARHGIAALPKPVRLRDLVATAEELLEWSAHGDVDAAARHERLAVLATGLLVR